jgi:hypothetical protein
VVSSFWGGCAGGRIWVDRAACAELAGVQGRGFREPDDHITIRLPSLLMDVVLQMLGESGRGQVRIGAHLLVVGHTERNYVGVRCQNPAAAHGPRAGVRLTSQQGFDLLGNDRSAEDPGEGVADGGFEFALDAVERTHVTPASHVVVRQARVPGAPHRVSSAPEAFLHGIGPGWRSGTRRTLRIRSAQVRAVK